MIAAGTFPTFGLSRDSIAEMSSVKPEIVHSPGGKGQNRDELI